MNHNVKIYIKDLDVLDSVEAVFNKTKGVIDAAIKYPGVSKLPFGTTTLKEPSNNNTIKQQKLYSTKKKRKLKDKPSAKVRKR